MHLPSLHQYLQLRLPRSRPLSQLSLCLRVQVSLDPKPLVLRRCLSLEEQLQDSGPSLECVPPAKPLQRHRQLHLLLEMGHPLGCKTPWAWVLAQWEPDQHPLPRQPTARLLGRQVMGVHAVVHSLPLWEVAWASG